MRRARALLACVMVVAAGCVGSGPHTLPTQVATASSPRISPIPIPSSPSPPELLPEVVLQANLSEAPTAWRLVATIPFGDAPDRLGEEDYPGKDFLPLLPSSFAVDPDGSLWFVDWLKARVAHYSSAGAYLGQLGGLRYDAHHPRPEDLAFVDGRMYLLQRRYGFYLPSQVGTFDDGRWAFRTITADGVKLFSFSLVAGPGALTAWVDREANMRAENPRGPSGIASISPDGRAQLLAGAPMTPGEWVKVGAVPASVPDPRADEKAWVTFTGTAGGVVQPIHVRLVTGSGGPAKTLEGIVGMEQNVSLKHAVPLYVQVSPARPDDAERYGGGVWYLELSSVGKPLVWERLPLPEIDGPVVRHLTVGPDGSIYLMVPTHHGMEIFRRPTT